MGISFTLYKLHCHIWIATSFYLNPVCYKWCLKPFFIQNVLFYTLSHDKITFIIAWMKLYIKLCDIKGWIELSTHFSILFETKNHQNLDKFGQWKQVHNLIRTFKDQVLLYLVVFWRKFECYTRNKYFIFFKKNLDVRIVLKTALYYCSDVECGIKTQTCT